jgi:hypothetical protein
VASGQGGGVPPYAVTVEGWGWDGTVVQWACAS